jgi:hypothetical protein
VKWSGVQGVGEKGLAAQDTAHVVELCPLARSFARSPVCVRADGSLLLI